ncbi:MAG TPA: AMP-binding protein, partial [Gammaproteobacteria bacterium]|nr:AMP-binding protein [Gammaproteobacteria bacterium]
METIDHLISEGCRRAGDQTALRHKVAGTWQDLSYADLQRHFQKIAAGLLEAGLKPGERCALLASSSPWWVAAYLATLRAGGVAVPVDKELKTSELRHILDDSGARVVFTEDAYLETLLELVSDLPDLERIVLLKTGPAVEENDPALAGTLSALGSAWRKLLQEHAIPAEKATALEELARSAYQRLTTPSKGEKGAMAGDFLSQGRVVRNKWQKSGRLVTLGELEDAAAPPVSPRRPEDLAVILYTSGTTGQSKGAMLSHANITSNIAAACKHLQLEGPVTTLSFLPINHVFEQVCGILLPLSLGGTVSFAESLKKLGENLAEVQPSFFLGVPAVYRMVLDRIHKNVSASAVSRWMFALPLTRGLVAGKIRRKVGPNTIFISGGAALDPAVAAGFRTLGMRLYQGYGITETAPVVAAEHPGCVRPGTVGCPLPGVEVRIAHPNEEGVGEILVKGPNVMLGYFNNPRA